MLRRTFLVSAVVLAAGAASVGRAQVATNWPSENPPRPLPSRPVSFPPYELRTLPNGMQVIVVMHHEQPEVTMRLIVRAGGAYDPPGKGGTASLVASLLNQGTATRSANEIADAIDSIGGALDTSAGSDVTSATVLVMKDSFDVGMNMLGDVIRRPAFSPEEIERQRTQTIQNLGVSLEDPDFIARAVLSRLIYGFHPYGFPDSGMPETIAKITREDLREFHRRYFAPNNSILAIVGDVTADEAMAAADARVRRLAAPGRAAAAAAGSAASHAPHRRHRQARLGADRGARRAARYPAQVAGLHEHGPGRFASWAARAATGCSASFARSAGLRIPHPPT